MRLVFLLAVFAICSCKPRTDADASLRDQDGGHQGVHWGYPGDEGAVLPDAWSTHWPDCGGNEQSPQHLKLTTGNSVDLNVDFNETDYTIVHNGHTIQFTPEHPERLLTTDKDGRIFKLLQFHIHTPAEHTIEALNDPGNLRHYPGEIHFVHKYADDIQQTLPPPDRQLLVYGVFLEPAARSNPAFGHIVQLALGAQAHPSPGQDFVSEISYSEELKPSAGKFNGHRHHIQTRFRGVFYEGSLTTPPCTEAVNWYVRPSPVSIESNLLQALATRIGTPNNRPTLGTLSL